MATVFKSIRRYFDDGESFVVPNYQRGYKWAVRRDGRPSAVEKLVDDLLEHREDSEYFLQGVTVSEQGHSVVIIDGQQRTTTLYLLMWYLNPSSIQPIKLVYDIREESKVFIAELKNKSFEEGITAHESSLPESDGCKEDQDIFYFKEALSQINQKLKGVSEEEKDALLTFILDSVFVIYIKIDKEQAVKTFTMMNGSKASMKDEELIKSDMLRRISLPDFEERSVSTSIEDNIAALRDIIASDWETNSLRSRYAREWDKWLQWWNKDDVREYFNIPKNKVLGLLLDTYCKRHSTEKKLSFDSFRRMLESPKGMKQSYATKQVFKEIRDLQKSFEDVFNNSVTYNYLKLSLIASNNDDRDVIIAFFFNNLKNENRLKRYTLGRLVEMSHSNAADYSLGKVTEDDQKSIKRVYDLLASRIVFTFQDSESKSLAFLHLLYLNVDQCMKSLPGVKFDFSIWYDKSLEHIYPKSKFYTREGGVITRGDGDPIQESDITADMKERDVFFPAFYVVNEGGQLREVGKEDSEEFSKKIASGQITVLHPSEHCIGNLVLLYKNENSGFGAKPFSEKKARYFDLAPFKSRQLLHSIYSFAQNTWEYPQIKGKMIEFLNDYRKRYDVR